MYSSDFEKRYSDIEEHWERVHRLSTMEIISIIISICGIIVVLVLICRCCRRSKQGQIISPPPAPPGPLTTAPYPQQQFVAAYPVSSPYPSYPGVQVQMPAGVVSPAVMAPYPIHPPHQMPQPASTAPTAPDLTATLPPSYEQATGANMKQSPYNPSYPHS